jgi:hypothetical protein
MLMIALVVASSILLSTICASDFRFLHFILFVNFVRHQRYDPLSSCLVDFKSRANMASVKNCQFVISDPMESMNGMSVEAMLKADGEKDFVLQLGKVGLGGKSVQYCLIRVGIILYAFIVL